SKIDSRLGSGRGPETPDRCRRRRDLERDVLRISASLAPDWLPMLNISAACASALRPETASLFPSPNFDVLPTNRCAFASPCSLGAATPTYPPSHRIA
ncbi:hypothetical protein TOPH_02676, partial [Tolypocladium ophioglossoides CBS 100239]